MTRFCLLGPTYPYRGGIAHYTTLLTQALREEYETLLVSFSNQYPKLLFPGRSDRDPSKNPLRTEAEYLLNPLNPLSWRKALKRIRDWQPDVVIIPWWHPYFAPMWAIMGRGIKRLPSKPKLLFICHNVLPHEQSKISKIVLPSVTKLVLKAGDGFVVHSEKDGRLLRQFLPQASIEVTPLPTYQAMGGESVGTLPVAVPDDRPLLLFAGFVRPYKGLDVLLDALAIVLEKRPLHLLIAGEFWQGSDQYQAQIERLGISDAVTIIDEYLPDETLAACFERADVTVLPYRSATQSAVIQAAFGHGCPVITTDVGGLGEVVENGRSGLVVPPENPQALADALERYFAEDLGVRFREEVKGGRNGRFAWEKLVAVLSRFKHKI